MTNGLLDLPPSLDTLLLISLPFTLALVTLLHLRGVFRISSLWLLAFTTLSALAAMIAINAFIQVLEVNRIRYLMPLWPLTALLVGGGLWRLAIRHRILATGMLTLWLIYGAGLTVATEFRYELGAFFRRDFHQTFHVVNKLVSTSDLLVFDYSAVVYNSGWFYNIRNIYRYKSDPYEDVRPVNADYPYLWFIYLSKNRLAFADLPEQLDRVFCERALDEWGFTLERYALHSVENCPDRPIRLEFDSDIRLSTPEITLRDGLLRLDAHFRSEDDYLLSRYSLAVHVIDQSGVRVAQGDIGVGPGAIVPLRSEIDVSALPPGEYELRVALYDWRTGERLGALDPETGASGDFHTLHQFLHN